MYVPLAQAMLAVHTSYAQSTTTNKLPADDGQTVTDTNSTTEHPIATEDPPTSRCGNVPNNCVPVGVGEVVTGICKGQVRYSSAATCIGPVR